MPASRSPSRDAESTLRSRSYWPMVLIGLTAVLTVIVAAMPASVVTHFLPPAAHAEDFSGTVWHGSAGRISLDSRDAGALEWRLHPAALLELTLAADLHWVKVGFVVDAAVTVDRHGFTARAVKGGGPIEDLRDFGVAAGWRGTANVDFSEIKGAFVGEPGDIAKPLAAAGDVQVTNLTSTQIADGANLGSYDLHLADGAVQAGDVTAQLSDTGGPVGLQAVIRYTAKQHSALLTGTLRARPDAPAALRSQIDGIAQLRGRDAEGRVPVDLEFAL